MASTHGVLSTNDASATNNDLDFTARFPGPSSSRLKIQYIDPGVETAAESVVVSYDESTRVTLIAVTLRSVSAVLSTAAQVAAAVAAHPVANDLVAVTNKAANDGTGLVAALAATALSAGVNDATTGGYADADELEDDGWKLYNVTSANSDVQYVAEILVDGAAFQVVSATSDGRLKAAWTFKQQRFAKVGAQIGLNGAGTVD